MVLLKNFMRNSKAKQANIFVQVDGVDNVLETWWMNISMGWTWVVTLWWLTRTRWLFCLLLVGRSVGMVQHLENKKHQYNECCFWVGVFWIRVSSCHPRVINPNWQAFVSRIPQPSLVSLWNDVGWMYRQWILVDPRTMLGFGMLIMMIAATSGQTAFQQWPVWVEMLWLWTATGRDLIKIMEVFGHQLRYFQE